MSDSNTQLALDGGPKALDHFEGQGRPKVGTEEFLALAKRFGISTSALQKIQAALKDDPITSSPYLAGYRSENTSRSVFEQTARDIFGATYAFGVSSGTAALHCAFVAAGVGPGTEVICPAIGFMATAAAVAMAGGVPVFCDVDLSLGIDPEKIETCITPRTVAIAPTHVMGSVCNMEGVMAVARKHGLRVIEDCAQSCGGQFKDQYIGTFGDLGCFSISVYKIIGGGEGGILITHDERLYERACQMAECGGLWRPDRFAPPRYEGELFYGTNYRLSELEATVGAVQLRKLPDLVQHYRTVKQRVIADLHTFKEITPQHRNDPNGEVGYRLTFYPDTFERGQKIVTALNAEGIQCGMRGPDGPPDWHIYTHMFPITLKTPHAESGCAFNCPVYKDRGGHIEYKPGQCPTAEDLFDRSIRISLNPWYTKTDCQNIAIGINKVLSAYGTESESAPAW